MGSYAEASSLNMDDMQNGYYHLVDDVRLDIRNREFQNEYSSSLHYASSAEFSRFIDQHCCPFVALLIFLILYRITATRRTFPEL